MSWDVICVGGGLGGAALARSLAERGATVTEVVSGKSPSVRFRAGGASESASARLVVGADGRDSKLRGWLGFGEKRDPERLCLAGVLFTDYDGPDDASSLLWNLASAEESLIFPQGKGVLRAYMAYRSDTGVRRYSGKERIADFVRACHAAGVPEAWLARARAARPLPAFERADSRLDPPIRAGVAPTGH